MKENTSRNDSRGISRRNYLKRVAVGGLSITSTGLIANSARGADTVKVPAYVSDGEIVRYTKVNKEWWDYTTIAKQVAEEVKSSFLHHPKVAMIEETSADQELRKTGMLRDEVTVYASPDVPVSEVDAIIPDEMDRINITVRPWNQLRHTAYEQKYDPVPGGVVFEEGDDGSGGYDDRATICCRVDWNNKYRLLLPRHGFRKTSMKTATLPEDVTMMT